MEKKLAFHILQIAETENQDEIGAAYRKLLKMTNPEDDQEGFLRLRQAYETAISFARTSKTVDRESDTEQAGRDEVDFWIDRVDELYQDIVIRGKDGNWESLLNDPIATELDTALEAQEKMLLFLMDHRYLPHTVWKKLDEVILIHENMETLKEKFPADFLNYIEYCIKK